MESERVRTTIIYGAPEAVNTGLMVNRRLSDIMATCNASAISATRRVIRGSASIPFRTRFTVTEFYFPAPYYHCSQGVD